MNEDVEPSKVSVPLTSAGYSGNVSSAPYDKESGTNPMLKKPRNYIQPMNICSFSRNQVNVTMIIIVASVAMNVTNIIEHLYKPVLSIKTLKRIAPIIPENNIVSAMIDRSDGLNPNG